MELAVLDSSVIPDSVYPNLVFSDSASSDSVFPDRNSVNWMGPAESQTKRFMDWRHNDGNQRRQKTSGDSSFERLYQTIVSLRLSHQTVTCCSSDNNRCCCCRCCCCCCCCSCGCNGGGFYTFILLSQCFKVFFKSIFQYFNAPAF